MQEKRPASKPQLLLRNVPTEVIEAIAKKKIQIMTNNPYRTTVSDSEAIFKLVLKGQAVDNG
jgi:hypothetical protein